MKKFFSLLLLFTFVILTSCSDESTTSAKETSLQELSFVGFETVSMNDSTQTILIAKEGEYGDSLVVDFVKLTEGMTLYLAADDDPNDPELGERLEETSVIDVTGITSFNVVVLDANRRIDAIWTVTIQEQNASSSSVAKSSSSRVASSSSEIHSSSSFSVSSSSAMISSSSNRLSSSSVSSSSVVSSSSISVSSSSIASSSSVLSSSSAVILSSENTVLSFVVGAVSGVIDTTAKSIYVELAYGDDLSAVAATVSVSEGAVSSYEGVEDLRSPYAFTVTAEDGTVAHWTVKAGVQLPGSDFNTWANNKVAPNSFWGTSSDAMATTTSAIVYSYSSEANLTQVSGAAQLETKAIKAATGVITWKSKIATGILFAGTFKTGVTAGDLYKHATDFSQAANLLDYMTLGKDFTGRPTSFTVEYSYSPVAESGIVQKGLIYVMLVNKASKTIVASGAILPTTKVTSTTQTIALNYGDASWMTSDLPVPTGMTVGTGEEEVTSIYVIFASSAYAHIIGLVGAGNGDIGAKGVAGSTLSIGDFKLVY